MTARSEVPPRPRRSSHSGGSVVNETNAMWRAFKREKRQRAEKRELARMPEVLQLASAAGYQVQDIGEHGVRLVGPRRKVDYWPRTGTAMVVGGVRYYGCRPREVMRIVETGGPRG